MYRFSLLFTLTTLLFLNADWGYACPGGHGGRGPVFTCEKPAKCTIPEIVKSANHEIAYYLSQGLLDKTWSEIKKEKNVRKVTSGMELWEVLYFNPKVKEKKKQTIYVYLDLSGAVRGADFNQLVK